MRYDAFRQIVIVKTCQSIASVIEMARTRLPFRGAAKPRSVDMKDMHTRRCSRWRLASNR